MKTVSLRAVIALLLAVHALLASRFAQALPLETYGRLPTLEDIAISPDGTRIAFVRTTGNDRVVAITSLADGKLFGAVSAGKFKLRSIGWADKDRLLIVSSLADLPPVGMRGGVEEWYHLSIYDVSQHRGYSVPTPAKFPSMRIMDVIFGNVMVRHVEGHTLLYVFGVVRGNPSVLALFKIDLDTGSEKIVPQASFAQTGKHTWLVDEAGEIAAELAYAPADQRWTVRIRRDGKFSEVASGHEAFDPPWLLGFGPEPETLLMQFIEEGRPVWRLLSLKDGSLGSPMIERVELNSPIEDAGHRLIGGVRLDDDAHYVFFTPGMQAQWDAVAQAFPDEHLRLMSWTPTFSKVVVRVEGQRHGFVYELVDMDTRKAYRLGEVYEGLGIPLVVRKIDYRAGDGLSLSAYLTLPRSSGKNLPLVVLPHGGPDAFVTAEFDWWSQALADQGYAVLRPNYRGSSVNPRLRAAGFGQWGRKMQSDLSDGVRYLADSGIVDRKRVCIVGASYGGYAALAGVALESGVYRCAVAVSGISDLQLMLRRVNEKGSNAVAEQRYWDRYLGVSGADDAALTAISPSRHADAISAPVLLVHGRDDTVIPFEQTEAMYRAMRDANKQVELVALKEEDHWLSRSETRLEMLQAVVAFLRANNPPD